MSSLQRDRFAVDRYTVGPEGSPCQQECFAGRDGVWNGLDRGHRRLRLVGVNVNMNAFTSCAAGALGDEGIPLGLDWSDREPPCSNSSDSIHRHVRRIRSFPFQNRRFALAEPLRRQRNVEVRRRRDIRRWLGHPHLDRHPRRDFTSLGDKLIV